MEPSLPAWLEISAMSMAGLYGAAIARSRNVPVSGTLLAGILTGLGGGMVRDLLLGLEPVAIAEPPFIPAIAAATVIGALVFYRVMKINLAGLLLHGLVFGLLISIGCQKALVHGAPLASVVLCGALTASAGGMAVDALTRHRSSAFSQAHWVLTALLLGSTAYYVVAISLGIYAATLAAILVTTSLYTASVLRNWPSPKWPGESSDMSA